MLMLRPLMRATGPYRIANLHGRRMHSHDRVCKKLYRLVSADSDDGQAQDHAARGRRAHLGKTL